MPDKPAMMQLDLFSNKTVGWQPAEEMSKEEWIQFGLRIREAEGSFNWVVGDWLTAGFKWGELYAEAMEITGWDYKRLQKCKLTAETFDLKHRSNKLSWSTHYEIYARGGDKKLDYLAQAEAQGLSKRDVIEMIEMDKAPRLLPDPPRPEVVYCAGGCGAPLTPNDLALGYHYCKACEGEFAPPPASSEYTPIWKLERDLRNHLDTMLTGANNHNETKVQVLNHYRSDPAALDTLLAGNQLTQPCRKGDVRQAINNLIHQYQHLIEIDAKLAAEIGDTAETSDTPASDELLPIETITENDPGSCEGCGNDLSMAEIARGETLCEECRQILVSSSDNFIPGHCPECNFFGEIHRNALQNGYNQRCPQCGAIRSTHAWVATGAGATGNEAIGNEATGPALVDQSPVPPATSSGMDHTCACGHPLTAWEIEQGYTQCMNCEDKADFLDGLSDFEQMQVEEHIRGAKAKWGKHPGALTWIGKSLLYYACTTPDKQED